MTLPRGHCRESAAEGDQMPRSEDAAGGVGSRCVGITESSMSVASTRRSVITVIAQLRGRARAPAAGSKPALCRGRHGMVRQRIPAAAVGWRAILVFSPRRACYSIEGITGIVDPTDCNRPDRRGASALPIECGVPMPPSLQQGLAHPRFEAACPQPPSPRFQTR
jgi:hypothetical protein